MKLRDFQYRLLTNRLMTNTLRSKWISDVSPLCELCKKELETPLHLLCTCENVQKLWKAIGKWLKYFFQIDLNCNDQMIVYNNYKGKDKKFVNTCILVMKQYIYASKCLGKVPNFRNFTSKINEIYLDESYIAAKKW